MVKAILGFAWGHRNGEPGISNEDMAKYAVQHWAEYEHHSFQIEIATAVRSMGKVPDHEIVGLALKQKLSRDSDMITRGHLDGLVKQGFNLSNVEYNVLCKEEHWLGCKWFLLKELAARSVKQPQIHRVPTEVRFDPESSQWYTRNNSLVTRLYKSARGVESLVRGKIRLQDVVRDLV